MAGALCPVARAAGAQRDKQQAPFAPVVPGYVMHFPRDDGSHPAFRVEWWYVTGWLDPGPIGFQVTFFRVRPRVQDANPSAFAPRQIVIAHAAISDPALGRLVHAQRAARAGFGLAGAEPGRLRVWIDEWRLEQAGAGWQTAITADEIALELSLTLTQPRMLQGEQGLSRKGPAPEAASYYYSLPHLKVAGFIARNRARHAVSGLAWLDHEWSSQYLSEDASGWDWVGINLDDGAALMAFRMRDRSGGRLWAGGALRHAGGRLQVFSPEDVRFVSGRAWTSARTGTRYPVEWRIQAGPLELTIEPLFDDQEHDTRASTGTIYWEGAVRALREGRPVGLGYLELTGYWRRPDL
jgi:predicted secreted hydrolase